jgi:hypothetical protein
MRLGARLMTGLLVAVLALPLAPGLPLAEAGKKKFKTVTRTFASNGQISVPNLGVGGNGFTAFPYPATIEVGGFKTGKITDVNLTLKAMSHGNFGEFDIMLVNDNTNTVVMSDAATGDASDVTLTLDDEAAPSLPENGPLASGQFKPTDVVSLEDVFFPPAPGPSTEDALRVFDGLNPNGTWQLFVVDDAIAITGNIAGGWELEIATKVKVKKKKKQ